MERTTLAVLLTIGASAFGVLGDYFLKLASKEQHSLKTAWFWIGFAIYASTALGWVFAIGAPQAGDDRRTVFGIDDSAAHSDRSGVFPGNAQLLRDRRAGDGDCIARLVDEIFINLTARIVMPTDTLVS